MEREEVIKWLENATLEITSKAAEKWQDDTTTDELARGIIRAQRVLMDAITDSMHREEPANPLVIAAAIRAYNGMSTSIKALTAMADLRGK